MRLKKLGAALVIVVALGVVFASSAFAAASTTDVKWYLGEAPGTELVGSEGITDELNGTGSFETTVSGQAIVLHATGVECVECKIENAGGAATGSGKLKFSGFTVEKPAKCTTSSTVTTKPLSLQPDWMIGATNYWRVAPAAGEETAFFSIELTGAECPLKTTIVPKGTIFLQSKNATGTQAASQTLVTSGAINSAAGGTLHVGTSTTTTTTECTTKTTTTTTKFGTH